MDKNIETLVKEWFDIWSSGNIEDLPLAEDFIHTSPYGTIDGKSRYMSLVEKSRDMFLGNKFQIHDEIYHKGKACIRYTMISKSGTLEVSEWIYSNNGLISEIIAYYNLQEEKEAGRGIEIPE